MNQILNLGTKKWVDLLGSLIEKTMKIMVMCLLFIAIFQGVKQSTQNTSIEQKQIMNFEDANFEEVKVLSII